MSVPATLAGVEIMKRKTSTIKFLTEEEIKRFFKVIAAGGNKRDKALFLTGYRHGLRASEIKLLQVVDVDFQKMRLTVRRLKGSYSGVNPIQPDEARYLKAYLKARASDSPYLFLSRRGLPISRQMLDVLMKKYGEQAKIPEDKQHFHVLKHSIATHLLDAGADIKFVQDWLGHANIQNTEIYAKLSPRSREEKSREYFVKMPKF
jgi:site-specific recombinase XerD